MATFRLSALARADVSAIATTSGERWGAEASRRYLRLIAEALWRIADDPHGLGTRDRADVLAGIRSLALRQLREVAGRLKVKRPVHVLYYRVARDAVVEVVRVMHERMDPGRHLDVDDG
ncbi:MAG: type II toxin-antitoxin system RelE/ParE family toxin [Deltaproteobacteria bacterium]|nr:type II toxin-antitoxin system RelE/ParE family toxin [Deltaproteobacteria bacterium]